MKKTIKSLWIACACVVLIPLSCAEQFKIEGKPIKAKISYQHLNRISVKGDKIDSVIGIDTAFHFEKNEKTGEIFLRPTDLNGYNPISLSVTTVAGKTQDLLLEVTDDAAHSIELISDQVIDSFEKCEIENGDNGYSDYEESICEVMKKFITSFSKYSQHHIKCGNRNYKDVTAEFKDAYRIDGFVCLRYVINGNKDEPQTLDEKMFSKRGDIAISLSRLSIRRGDQVELFVIRR